MAVAGAVSGVMQVGRGVAAVPGQVMGPRQGKYWNEYDGKWEFSNLKEEEEALKGFPEDNSDLLGKAEDAAANKTDDGLPTEVKDPYYYDLLGVEANADKGAIKRKYYKLAKQYHPDKNPGDEQAAHKFKEVAEAYQVLSDDDKRIIYNKEGREGLAGNAGDEDQPKLDPAILFAFLFGSDKFNDVVGQLAAATSSLVGDSNETVSPVVARKVQKRRVARLALKLVERIEQYVTLKQSGSSVEEILAKWKADGEELTSASFGYQMVTTCGKIYNLIAVQNIGSRENGYAMPAMAEWAEGQKARIDSKKNKQENEMEKLKAGMDMMKLALKYQEKIDKAATEQEKQDLQLEMQKAAMEVTLRLLWAANVVDITATLHETCNLVFYDQSADKETRELRAEAVKELGSVWMTLEQPATDSSEEKDAARMYEEAAFAAMVETVKRKDEASHGSS